MIRATNCRTRSVRNYTFSICFMDRVCHNQFVLTLILCWFVCFDRCAGIVCVMWFIAFCEGSRQWVGVQSWWAMDPGSAPWMQKIWHDRGAVCPFADSGVGTVDPCQYIQSISSTWGRVSCTNCDALNFDLDVGHFSCRSMCENVKRNKVHWPLKTANQAGWQAGACLFVWFDGAFVPHMFPNPCSSVFQIGTKQ